MRLACVQSKYTEHARPQSMKLGDYERIVIIGGNGREILTPYVIIILFSGRCSSVVEQRFCKPLVVSSSLTKPLVVGSSPTIGSERTWVLVWVLFLCTHVMIGVDSNSGSSEAMQIKKALRKISVNMPLQCNILAN